MTHGAKGRRPSVAAGLLLFLASFLVVGCQSEDAIETYRVSTKIPEQLLPGKERMLAVMVPQGKQIWFFKVMGPEKSVDGVADQFRAFVKTVTFSERGEPVLGSLPEGWKRGGKKPLRFATIDINTPTKQLDLSVSALGGPKPGDPGWDAYVAQNVNRWRGQIGLDKSDDKWSGGESFEVASADGQAVFVDIVGEPGSGGPSGNMMGNMAAGGSTPPFMRQAKSGESGVSPTEESASNAPESDPSSSGGLKAEAPEDSGWRLGKRSMMRLAAFEAGPEDEVAQVTVISARGDLRDNVSRWMGQVQGGTPDDAAVDKMLANAEKLTVSGRPAQRFIIEGDASQDQQSIDATIVPLSDDGSSMFIKMTGPPETVKAETDSMRTFLETVSF